MVGVHAVLGHKQPVHGGPLEAPVPGDAERDGASVLRTGGGLLRVAVVEQRQGHPLAVLEPSFPLLLGPDEDEVLRDFTGKGPQPRARGGEDRGLCLGVGGLRAAGAEAPLASKLPAFVSERK